MYPINIVHGVNECNEKLKDTLIFNVKLNNILKKNIYIIKDGEKNLKGKRLPINYQRYPKVLDYDYFINKHLE